MAHNFIDASPYSFAVLFVFFKEIIIMYLFTLRSYSIWFRYFLKDSSFSTFFSLIISLSLSVMLIDVFMPFVIQDVFFSSFLVDFLIGACLSRALLKSQKKSFETQVCITIFCGKIPVYFLQIFSERVNVKISKVSVGSTYSFLL